MTCIITTVGASIFTNYNGAEGFIATHYEATKNALHNEWEDREERIQSIRTNPHFNRWISNHFEDSCAEIASLMNIIKTEGNDVDVRLLATDTVLSRLAAEMIKTQIINHPETGKTVSIQFDPAQDVIVGLRVDDADIFETDGLQNFIERFVTLKKQYDALILNITGGYKGLIPYLTIIGQINQVPVKYKFESSDALITIPQLPINFDWELAVDYGLQISSDLKALEEKDKRELVENNILFDDGKLTPLGSIFKVYAVKEAVRPQLRGHCAEFRWFEYYVSQYPNRKVRRSVGNGQRILGKKIYKEVDLVIEGDDKIIIAESKPRRYIFTYSEQPDQQIGNLLQELKENDIAIDEYHLCIYSTGGDNISDISKIQGISEIRSVVHKYYPECVFMLFLMTAVRELQGFMHKPLSNIKEQIQKKIISYP